MHHPIARAPSDAARCALQLILVHQAASWREARYAHLLAGELDARDNIAAADLLHELERLWLAADLLGAALRWHQERDPLDGIELTFTVTASPCGLFEFPPLYYSEL